MKVCVLVDGYARELEYDAPPTVQQLLADLALDAKAHWVACNRKMTRKDDLSRTTVDEGDVIEIYRIISGGQALKSSGCRSPTRRARSHDKATG